MPLPQYIDPLPFSDDVLVIVYSFIMDGPFCILPEDSPPVTSPDYHFTNQGYSEYFYSIDIHPDNPISFFEVCVDVPFLKIGKAAAIWVRKTRGPMEGQRFILGSLDMTKPRARFKMSSVNDEALIPKDSFAAALLGCQMTDICTLKFSIIVDGFYCIQKCVQKGLWNKGGYEELTPTDRPSPFNASPFSQSSFKKDKGYKEAPPASIDRPSPFGPPSSFNPFKKDEGYKEPTPASTIDRPSPFGPPSSFNLSSFKKDEGYKEPTPASTNRPSPFGPPSSFNLSSFKKDEGYKEPTPASTDRQPPA